MSSANGLIPAAHVANSLSLCVTPSKVVTHPSSVTIVQLTRAKRWLGGKEGNFTKSRWEEDHVYIVKMVQIWSKAGKATLKRFSS